jgi:hypothetical protein
MKRKLRSNLYCVSITMTTIVLIANIASAQINTGIATITPTERLDIGSGNVRIRDVYTTTGDPINDRVLTANSSGVVKSVPGASMINIYTANGTLSSDRNVTQGINTLTFSGTTASTVKIINTAGTSAAPVSALQIVDGSQLAGKVLTSDANGNSSWTFPALKAISGTLPATSSTFSSYGASFNVSMYTGGSITLPPGKWMVSFGSTAAIASGVINSDGSLWCTFFLSNINTGTAEVHTPDLIAAYSGARGAGGTIGRGMTKAFVSGNCAVNNSTTGNKTYYLWANQEQNGSSTTTTSGGNAYWQKVFDPGNWERYFYAIPIQ